MSFNDLGSAANPIVIDGNSPTQVVVVCSSSDDDSSSDDNLDYEPGEGAWNVTEERFMKIIGDKTIVEKLKARLQVGDLQRGYAKAKAEKQVMLGGKWDQAIRRMRNKNGGPSYEQIELMDDVIRKLPKPKKAADAAIFAGATAVALELVMFEALNSPVTFSYT